jgi:hypothetical protein
LAIAALHPLTLRQDYIYAVAPLLEDALVDRDLVHRQVRGWAGRWVGGRHSTPYTMPLCHVMVVVP